MKEVIMQVQSFSADYPKAPIYVGDLVRCKDCNNYSVEGKTTQFGWCNALEMPTDEQSFCSYGERREDDKV